MAPEPIAAKGLSLASDGAVRGDVEGWLSAHLRGDDHGAGPPGPAVQGRRVLALNSLSVHSAAVNSTEGLAINTFVVSPHFGDPPAAELLRQQFIPRPRGDWTCWARWKA